MRVRFVKAPRGRRVRFTAAHLAPLPLVSNSPVALFRAFLVSVVVPSILTAGIVVHDLWSLEPPKIIFADPELAAHALKHHLRNLRVGVRRLMKEAIPRHRSSGVQRAEERDTNEIGPSSGALRGTQGPIRGPSGALTASL